MVCFGEEVNLAEKGAKGGAGGGGNAKTSLAAGPDGDIQGGVEEVGEVGEGREVRNTDYCCC